MELQASAGFAGSTGSHGRGARASGRLARRAGPLLTLVLAAVVVRALASLLAPNVIWPDETFQTAEQALRLVTGRGMVPWEYQIGARSWILPVLVAPLVAAGRAVSGDPRVALGLITALMIALSAANVWAAYVLGARLGRLQALFAAGLAAGWCELVYYSPHLLPDTISGALLLAGLAAASQAERRRRLFWTGVLLGTAFVVRIQLAPAIGLVMLMTGGRAVRDRWAPLAAGFALPLAALGALDWLTWGAPFRSILTYLKTNLGGVAGAFGAEPAAAYLGWEVGFWGPAAPLILAAAVLGARRAPAVAATAALVLLTFSAVGHKEPRFLYPGLLLLFVLCGIGAGELASDLGRLVRAPWARRLVPLVLVLVWAAASLAVGFGDAMRPLWTRAADALRALDAVNADPRSCGLGLDQPNWSATGLSRMRDGVQLYDATRTPAEAYDYLLRLPPAQRPAATYAAEGFTRVGCWGADGACLYRRPGPCVGGHAPLQAASAPKVRAALQKLGYAVY